ncbi:MAG: TlpA disulfide reductase family protein [Desulfuromonadaceae bacterium]|nr:TlpA disulfide reductase family protein [Desulfuromonadaceae bacterium]
MTKRIICLFMVWILLSVLGCTKSESGKSLPVAKENSQAPDISVISVTDGSTLKLSDLKGKVVLLNFWATWCPPCRQEIPSMMKLEKAMIGRPFQMVAVSVDEGGKPVIESLFKETGYKLPAYLDLEGKAVKSYGITGVPESFILDKNGVIVKKIIGGFDWDSPDVASFLEGLMK